MDVTTDYKFSPYPEVAAAEKRWLEAIETQQGHAAINDRWQVVVRLQERAEALERRDRRWGHR